MKGRDFLLFTFFCAAMTLIVKVTQVVVTPELWTWLTVARRELLDSSAVGFMLVSVAILFLLSLIAVAWDRAERRWERAERERQAKAALRTMGWAAVPDDIDTSSLLDDSPRGPLPDSWRAPCGEPVRLSTPNDRGPKAAA